MIDQKILDYIKTSLDQGKTKEDLYKELISQGITVEAIQGGFDLINTESKKEDVSKKTIQIILIIAAVSVGAGIFSFIAANWTEMTKLVKIGIILISMVTFYGSGWHLKENLNFLKTGDALILLGAIVYGAGIFLVAQMFNIRANWPDGFILWMLGVIVMAFATRSYPLFYFSLPLGFISIVGHPFIIFTNFGHNSFLLTSSFLLLITTIITFITGWTIRKQIPPEFKNFC